MKIISVAIGDVVKMKKAHPCGSNEWEINKIGMDIGLTCLGCGRKTRLDRSRFNSRFSGYISRVNEEGEK